LRKLLIGALVGVLALAVTAVALAATQQSYSQSFSTNKANKSAGTTFSTDSTDPANTANNSQPKSVRVFTVVFPGGTKIDNLGAPQCKKTDDEILQAGGKPACPKAVVGSGSAKVRLPFPGFGDINATVTAFNANKGLILYVNPQGAQAIILRSKFQGLKLVTAVPPNCLPPATIQGGQCKKPDGSAGQEAILSHFDLKTVPKSAKVKKKKHALITTPKTCKGKWAFRADLTYADGTKASFPSTQACKK
jgi:hypothetical protein